MDIDDMILPDGELFPLPGTGRNLCYHVFGDLTAPARTRTIFYCHGEPGSLLEALIYDSIGKNEGFRIVGVDRPGMGRSTLQPNRRVIDWPVDLLALAEHLEAERFAVVGVSGGAPYVFACANEIPPERLIGCFVLSGAMPSSLGLTDLSWRDRIDLNLSLWCINYIERQYTHSVELARDTHHPERLEEAWGKSLSRTAPDRKTWEHGDSSGLDTPEEIRAFLVESGRRALLGGTHGPAVDTHAILADWGFRLEDLAKKVQGASDGDMAKVKLVIWQGTLDQNCPIQTARKGQTILQNAEWFISEGEGHLSIIIGKRREVINTVLRILDEKKQ